MTMAVKEVQTEEQKKQAARRAELEKELESLGKKNPNIRFQVTSFVDKKGNQKVGINIHGITAKPMFLYGSQALALVQVIGDLQAFVEEHRAALSWQETKAA